MGDSTTMSSIIESAVFKKEREIISKITLLKEPYLRKILSGEKLSDEEEVKLSTIEEVLEKISPKEDF